MLKQYNLSLSHIIQVRDIMNDLYKFTRKIATYTSTPDTIGTLERNMSVQVRDVEPEYETVYQAIEGIGSKIERKAKPQPMPWDNLIKHSWLIVGMNHYRQNGKTYLYCSISRRTCCFTVEGEIGKEAELFKELERKAGLI